MGCAQTGIASFRARGAEVLRKFLPIMPIEQTARRGLLDALWLDGRGETMSIRSISAVGLRQAVLSSSNSAQQQAVQTLQNGLASGQSQQRPIGVSSAAGTLAEFGHICEMHGCEQSSTLYRFVRAGQRPGAQAIYLRLSPLSPRAGRFKEFCLGGASQRSQCGLRERPTGRRTACHAECECDFIRQSGQHNVILQSVCGSKSGLDVFA